MIKCLSHFGRTATRDRQMDGWTDRCTHDHSIYSASIVLCGKDCRKNEQLLYFHLPLDKPNKLMRSTNKLWHTHFDLF